MEWQFWGVVLLYVLIPIGVFVGRNWVKARIERGVEHRFAAQLELLRADLEKSKEEFRSSLRSKETEVNSIRDAVLSGRGQRQASVDKRQLEAIEKIWSDTNNTKSL